VPTWEGWLYLATVIDIASRRVAGWATADHLRTGLVANALTNAGADRDPNGVTFPPTAAAEIRSIGCSRAWTAGCHTC
jgi:transposase InsO family protein